MHNFNTLKVKNKPENVFLNGIINVIHISVPEDKNDYLIARGSLKN